MGVNRASLSHESPCRAKLLGSNLDTHSQKIFWIGETGNYFGRTNHACNDGLYQRDVGALGLGRELAHLDYELLHRAVVDILEIEIAEMRQQPLV